MLLSTTDVADCGSQGLDLAPLQPTGPIPNNVNFMVEDAAKPLPFPDEYFDVVHARAIEFGVSVHRYTELTHFSLPKSVGLH